MPKVYFRRMLDYSLAKLSATRRKSFGGTCGSSILVVDANANHTVSDLVLGKRSAVILKAGYSWNTVDCSTKSIRPQEVCENGIWRSTINFIVTGRYADRIDWLQKMQRNQFMVKITDRNKQTTVYGLPNAGLEFSFSFDGKSIMEERAEFYCTLKGSSIFPAFILGA